MKFKRIISQLIAAGLLASATAKAALINVTTDVASAETWYATNTYLLQTIVYVQSNAVLSIEPGTVIKGATNVNTLIAKPGVPNLVSALWVTRGGQLYATGTCENPIIFTFEGDDVNNPSDVATNASGLWGGVVLLGRGQINSAQDAVGNVASPKYEVYEGTTGAGTIPEQVFGGNDDTDNSGVLRYVSIRYPGNVFAPNRELNGLTMGAVGSGTTIEYIEVFNSSDDAFEWWGGNVSTKYLVAAYCEDDDFDTDQGYRGTNQFWFGIKPTWNGSTDSRGFETDGDLNQTGYPGNNATPTSTWAVFNATLIGRGTNVSGFGGGVGWNPRDEARPNVYDSVVTDFASGILVDTDGTNEFVTGVADVRNTIFYVANNLTGGTSNAMSFLFTDAARSNTVESALLSGISYAANSGLNPRPQGSSPALSGVLGGAPVAVNYRGAFNTNECWADGWTALYRMGFLSRSANINQGATIVNVTADITGNVTWTSNNTYLLQTIVYVQSNAVLSIEPGTVIKGATNVNTLIAKPGVPNLVSALWVTRGGQLYATGTVCSPIIFTFEGDDVKNPNDIATNASGLWGGVVLLGRGQINSAQDAVGNVASPRYEVYEGTTGAGTIPEQVFGGNDDTDNSGVLRYVSIRYPGNVFAPNRELNGLTMGAVGSGTTIEYIEVFNSSDDAFEWWGGNVSTKYLVAAYCEDDDFDTDQGYRGTNQFWFGIKPTWNGSTDSRGFETDGDLNQTGYPGNNATPTSTWAVFNATLIGRGTNVSGFGGGVGWNPRDEARPNVYDSIVTDFASGILVDTDGTNEFVTGVADVRNTIFHVANNLTSGTSNAMSFLFTDAARSNTVESALLSGISYAANVGLNPQPQGSSPALSGVLGGAPVAVGYRGAFSTTDQWAHGWTAIYQMGFLAGVADCACDDDVIVVPPPTAPILSIVQNGANVDISFATQAGYSYQLQSASPITGGWTNVGAPTIGTGGTITISRPLTGDEQYFRVRAQ